MGILFEKGVRIFIFVLCVLFVLVIKFKMADDEASKSRASFGSPGGSKKFSFDGEHVVIQLDENGYLPPECSKYQYRYKTATFDQSVVDGYCGIKDYDAYVSPTKYKAYRNDLPNRHGAPYDYREYMKYREEYYDVANRQIKDYPKKL